MVIFHDFLNLSDEPCNILQFFFQGNSNYHSSQTTHELLLNPVLKDLKLKITDLWKEENLVNLLMPLSIKIKFQHSNIQDLDKLKKTFYKISIIEDYTLEQFNINNSFLTFMTNQRLDQVEDKIKDLVDLKNYVIVLLIYLRVFFLYISFHFKFFFAFE